MIFRVVFFSIISLAIAFYSLRQPAVLGAFAGGLCLGLPLAWLGLRLTRFENSPEGNYYTPNTWIGLSVVLILVGRLAYRLIVISDVVTNNGARPTMFQSPLTLSLLGLSAGYYIAYYSGVLFRTHRHRQN